MNPFSALWNGLLGLLGSALAFFYEIVPNYGVAIILLTVVIMLLLFPLTLKQTRSMRAMQTIQPEVKRLQKEYKNDREEMNKQLMALYQERNINPAAGCLPLLLQGPIWFALFRVLSVTNPESGPPIISDAIPSDSALAFAINAGKTTFLNMDLLLTPGDALGVSIGQAIPYMILIILIVASGFFQQHQMMRRRKDAPAQEQSAQTQSVQRAMRFMPLIIGVFSWRFPGGLVLYFAASNLFRIAQQAVILRDEKANGDTVAASPAEPTHEAIEEPPAKPPAKRSPNASKKKKRKRK